MRTTPVCGQTSRRASKTAARDGAGCARRQRHLRRPLQLLAQRLPLPPRDSSHTHYCHKSGKLRDEITQQQQQREGGGAQEGTRQRCCWLRSWRGAMEELSECRISMEDLQAGSLERVPAGACLCDTVFSTQQLFPEGT